MNHLNTVLLGGFVANEPRLVTTSKSGCKAVAFAICNHQYHKPKEVEEWNDDVLFMDVVLWGMTAPSIFADLKKGADVTAVGKLKCHTWVNKEGIERKTIQIRAEHIEYKKLYKGKEKSLTIDALEDDGDDSEVREKEVLYDF